jgi:hypothetical protein
MASYIVYRLDGVGKIQGAEWVDAISDRFALEAARALAGPGGCEVWQRDRQIGRVGLHSSACSPCAGMPAYPAFSRCG